MKNQLIEVIDKVSALAQRVEAQERRYCEIVDLLKILTERSLNCNK